MTLDLTLDIAKMNETYSSWELPLLVERYLEIRVRYAYGLGLVRMYLMHAYKNENQLRFGFGLIVLLSVQDNTCKNKDVQAVLLYYLVMLPYQPSTTFYGPEVDTKGESTLPLESLPLKL